MDTKLLQDREDAWQSMEGAPQDGTQIWLRNGMMDHPVVGKWGEYYASVTGKYYTAWVLVADPKEPFLPMRPGELIRPTEWQPYEVAA